MNEYYDHMRDDIGIDPNMAQDDEDPELDRVLKNLR